ncbi:MAG: class I SAM-dependent methyltransferase [Planctomycetaceae bacterium]|nr:class I SAM-dependent methyltransferase [Planctomycetaceae bacterium]
MCSGTNSARWVLNRGSSNAEIHFSGTPRKAIWFADRSRLPLRGRLFMYAMFLLKPPIDFDEAAYLAAYPEIAQAKADRIFDTGWQHFSVYGWREGRWRGLKPLANPHNGLPVPSPHLRYRIHGAVEPMDLCRVGNFNANLISEVIRTRMGSTENLRVLDFGCGCGNVSSALAFMNPGLTVYGTDIDEEAIRWCRDNIGSVVHSVANSALPPLPFEANFFDFIYCVSVFTHLPEDMQFAWLDELKRVLKPGGYAWATFHGENHVQGNFAQYREQWENRGFVYDTRFPTEGLPEFYQTTLHHPRYIEREWSKHLHVVEIKKMACGQGDFAHDTALLHKAD